MRLIITIAVIVTVGFATDEEAADNVIIAENTFYEVPPARALSDETNLVESLLANSAKLKATEVAKPVAKVHYTKAEAANEEATAVTPEQLTLAASSEGWSKVFWFTGGSRYSWQKQHKVCISKGMGLCRRNQICAGGNVSGGKKNGDSWIATSDSDNSWLQVGNGHWPACQLHTEIANGHHGKPSWGGSARWLSFRYNFACCMDHTHYYAAALKRSKCRSNKSIPGSKWWSSCKRHYMYTLGGRRRNMARGTCACNTGYTYNSKYHCQKC
jgi:hypothetical protein